jgi:hypothetical protein
MDPVSNTIITLGVLGGLFPRARRPDGPVDAKRG